MSDQPAVFLPAAVDGVLFALPLFDVWEVDAPPQTVAGTLASPLAPRGFLGVASVGGLTTMIDLRRAFGLPAARDAPGAAAAFMTIDAHAYGLVFDAVGLSVASSGVAPLPTLPIWARGCATEGRRSPVGVLAVFDWARFLAPKTPDAQLSRGSPAQTPLARGRRSDAAR